MRETSLAEYAYSWRTSQMHATVSISPLGGCGVISAEPYLLPEDRKVRIDPNSIEMLTPSA